MLMLLLTSWPSPGRRWPAPALWCICEAGLGRQWFQPGLPPGWRSADRPQSAASHTYPGRRDENTEKYSQRENEKKNKDRPWWLEWSRSSGTRLKPQQIFKRIDFRFKSRKKMNKLLVKTNRFKNQIHQRTFQMPHKCRNHDWRHNIQPL